MAKIGKLIANIDRLQEGNSKQFQEKSFEYVVHW